MMNVCYCGNSGVFPGLLLSLLSLREQTSEVLAVYLVSGDFTSLDERFVPLGEKERLFLEKTLQEKNPDSRVVLLDDSALFLKEFLHSPNLKTPYTPYSMLRMVFDLESRLPDRLLYLDTDTIFLKDPSLLYAFDLGQCDRGMVPDAVLSGLLDERYCNSGVILLDLKKIRANGLLQAGRALLNEKHYTMPDQEALNHIQSEGVLLLPRCFNEQREIRPDTVIRHYCQQVRRFPLIYVEKAKPWEGERFQKAYPKDVYPALFSLFEKKKREFLKLR
jgi:lipopolysaccharide biosynthesis glycosyltransferase